MQAQDMAVGRWYRIHTNRENTYEMLYTKTDKWVSGEHIIQVCGNGNPINCVLRDGGVCAPWQIERVEEIPSKLVANYSKSTEYAIY